MMDVSEDMCVTIPEELRAALFNVPKLAPVKVPVAAALAVIKGMSGAGGGFRAVRSLNGRERFRVSLIWSSPH
jgi:hypothetical protein